MNNKNNWYIYAISLLLMPFMAQSQILTAQEKKATITFCQQDLIAFNKGVFEALDAPFTGIDTSVIAYSIIPIYRLFRDKVIADVLHFDSTKIDFTFYPCETKIYYTRANKGEMLYRSNIDGNNYSYYFSDTTNRSKCHGSHYGIDKHEPKEKIRIFMVANPHLHVFKIVGLAYYWCYMNGHIYKLIEDETYGFCLIEAQEFWRTRISLSYLCQLFFEDY